MTFRFAQNRSLCVATKEKKELSPFWVWPFLILAFIVGGVIGCASFLIDLFRSRKSLTK